MRGVTRARGARGVIEATRGKGRLLLGLIQVQRRCRRLYDDEEHLRDSASLQFPRCADVAPVHRVASCACPHDATRYLPHSCAYTTRNGDDVTREHACVCVCVCFSCATSHGCMGPICIWTRARGDASSIISPGITPRVLEERPRVFPASIPRADLMARSSERKRNMRDDIIKEPCRSTVPAL